MRSPFKSPKVADSDSAADVERPATEAANNRPEAAASKAEAVNKPEAASKAEAKAAKKPEAAAAEDEGGIREIFDMLFSESVEAAEDKMAAARSSRATTAATTATARSASSSSERKTSDDRRTSVVFAMEDSLGNTLNPGDSFGDDSAGKSLYQVRKKVLCSP